MIDQDRNDQGKFTYKGNSERKVRTIRLTDETWNLLGEKSDENDMSKADYLEALATNQISWDTENNTESNLDFDVDEVAEILKEALTLKSNAGGKIKAKIKEDLEIMGIDLNDE